MKKRFGFIGTLMVAIFALTGVAHADGHLKFPIGEGNFSWDSYHAFAKAHDFSGQQLTAYAGYQGKDQEKLEAMLAYFEEATGVDVRYTGSKNYVQDIMVDAEAGASANVTGTPLTGFNADLAKRGFLTKLDPDIADWMRDNYASGQSFVDLGTYADPDGNKALYAFHFDTQVKSLLWYVPENFEDAGYKVPQSMEELKALSDRIVADGGTPWCIALYGGAATGWPGSDWVEDMMLRTQPPQVYDQWISNEVPFDDPRIIAAIEEFGAFVHKDGYVAEGDAVATVHWRDSPNGMFESPPQCYMHRAASYITHFFKKGTVVGEDVDFTYFPSYAGKDLGKPVLGGGGFWMITKDSPAAQGFIKWLQTPIAHELFMAQGGFLSPHKHVNKAVFPDRATAKMNDILLNATTFRYDGSDSMPGAVGAGTFWKGMVDYVGGKDSAAVARDIQKSWDAIK